MATTIELDKHAKENLENSQMKILLRYIFIILPQVKKRLKYWEKKARSIEDEVLKAQALSSLNAKAFHCQGGSVYAVNHEDINLMLDLIIAYQTICDYLDNLCDRAGVTDEKAFATLHLALLDALTPDEVYHDYYDDYNFKYDSGYLKDLVSVCKNCIRKMPSYFMVYSSINKLVNLYIDLQVKKHVDWTHREKILIEWANHNKMPYPFLYWPEFAAASGSTLAIFALFSLASKSDLSILEVQETVKAYFPWICGLHILLDYYIDQEEDKFGGDLNFTFYYNSDEEMMERLKLFYSKAKSFATTLPNSIFHLTVVQGLCAMYLSDVKFSIMKKQKLNQDLLLVMDGNTRKIYHICKIVRKFI